MRSLKVCRMKHEATCCCGQLKVIYEGEITKTGICHCLQCQKRTGSAFGVQTRLEKSKVTISGDSTVYQRSGDEPEIAWQYNDEIPRDSLPH